MSPVTLLALLPQLYTQTVHMNEAVTVAFLNIQKRTIWHIHHLNESFVNTHQEPFIAKICQTYTEFDLIGAEQQTVTQWTRRLVC